MSLSEAKSTASPFHRFSTTSLAHFFDQYRTYDELVEFMEKLHDRYPDVVELIELGETWEGRRLLGVRIRAKKTGRHGLEDDVDWEWEYVDDTSHNGRKRRKRHAIVITGGQHAREWVSIMTAAYIAHDMATKHSDKDMHDILRFFDFHIFPTVNPDGYVYSHTTDRMWRKNRQPTEVEYCLGTDLNHNWGYRWGDDGTGTNPCSDNYRGSEAFSAPETRRLAEYMDGLKRLISFIDLHTYSQYWMYPYAAECDKVPRDHEDLVELAIGAVHALKEVHNTQFGIGSACSLLYKASGNAIDWTYVEADVKYSYYLELRDTGTYGFLLPPKQIVPSGEETLAGILAVAKFVMERETL